MLSEPERFLFSESGPLFSHACVGPSRQVIDAISPLDLADWIFSAFASIWQGVGPLKAVPLMFRGLLLRALVSLPGACVGQSSSMASGALKVFDWFAAEICFCRFVRLSGAERRQSVLQCHLQ